jgi:hypothetical protein
MPMVRQEAVGEVINYPLDMTGLWRVVGDLDPDVALTLVQRIAPNAVLKANVRASDTESAMRRWGPAVIDRWFGKRAVVIAADEVQETALAVYHHDSRFMLLSFDGRRR